MVTTLAVHSAVCGTVCVGQRAEDTPACTNSEVIHELVIKATL